MVALGKVGCLASRVGVQACGRPRVTVALAEVGLHRGVTGQGVLQLRQGRQPRARSVGLADGQRDLQSPERSQNRRVAQAIARRKGYPAAARARRETGDVEITFTLESNGTVASSRVIRSSGFAALDQEALDTIRRAAPYPPPPAGVWEKQLEFTLTLGFNMRDAPKR